MDPILIFGAITANDRNRQQLTTTRHPSRNVTSNSTRSWRPGATRLLRRLADLMTPPSSWKDRASASGESGGVESPNVTMKASTPSGAAARTRSATPWQ
jgi:hypothetical protein